MLLHDILEHHARIQPSRVALSAPDGEIGWRALRDRVLRRAASLRAAGIGRGDRVAILAHSTAGYVETLFGVTRLGAALVPLNHLLIGRELTGILRNAEVRALLYAAEFRAVAEEIRPALPAGSRFLCFDGEALPADGDLAGDVPAGDETGTALVIYTCGISGGPRGAMLSHRNLMSAAVSSGLELSLSRDDVFLSCAPLPFTAGTGRLLRFLHAGAAVILHREFDPEETLRTIERRSVTRVLLTPTMMARILQLPSAGSFNLSTLRTILYGGTAIPIDLLKRAIRFFRCGLVQTYGHVESSGVLTFLHEEDHSMDESAPYMRKLMSVGKEAIGVEVRVVDESGLEIAPNQVGEIVARGPNVFGGYWNDPVSTAQSLKDGWLRTGDVASIDEEGYIYIVDRKYDTLMVGGLPVYPREVEGVLSEHPAVKEAVIVARPDYTMGEVPVAVVVLREGAEADSESILSHCARNMAPFKVPQAIEFLPALPRNSQGKVLRARLRERLAVRRPA
ncbi:MAG TPA: AMP-binding protein [Candidatus Deferrimicrobiaceae bacterium]